MKSDVAVVMGSDSDLPGLRPCLDILAKAKVGFDVAVLSAHRTPDLLRRYVADCERAGVRVFIAAAGGAAHLPGVIAAQTNLPVIGVPMESQLKGVDSLLSMVQMPSGIPVATVALGRAGATNAAILALQILALGNPELGRVLRTMRREVRDKVVAANRRVRTELHGQGGRD
ncbi:MAG: 5-(carboxyamino)imidazole ribonucleotide mutase [candidate division WOR-3 bacterium]